jgi:predicted DNA-binding protein with PD1-like motif
MRLKRLFPMLLLLCTFSTGLAESSRGNYHALRLKPGQDLKIELTRFLKENEIRACAVVTCVGSLTWANLRFANEPEGSRLEGPFEIVSLVGCGGKGSWHLHLSVSDREGKMTGGHLMEGSIVRTTAEIVLVELTELEFERLDDPQTGYKELKIRKP